LPAFKKFQFGDQIDNVLVMQPKYDLVSGSAGWRGSPEGGSSLSLYGGARRSSTDVFRDIRYQSTFPGINQFGQPTRGQPLTASVNLVWMTDEDLALGQVTSTRWGEEHWDTVQRLYQDYKAIDPDFITGSYDFYSVYFQKDSGNCVTFQGPRFSSTDFPSGSWTIESWVKPLLTASSTNDFTIVSMNRTLWLGITGSSGRLAFSSSVGSFTASLGPTKDQWSHVAVSYDSTSQTASFRINLVDAGSFGHPALSPPASFTASFTIGQRWSGTLSTNAEDATSTPAGGMPSRSFHGMIGETRFWFVRRTDTQLSSSMTSPLTGSAATGSYYCVRFNEGPYRTFGTNSLLTTPADGSGTLNQSTFGGTNAGNVNRAFGFLRSFNDRVGPSWLPSDNVNVIVPKTTIGTLATASFVDYVRGQAGTCSGMGSLQSRRMWVLDVPSAFYGRQITPGSVRMTCNAYSAPSFSLVRTLIDDGRGGLFISGSMASGSAESYRGVEWNKVGNVFYSEGLIIIKDPSLFDFGRDDGSPERSTDSLQVSFRGDSRIPVKTVMCRIDRGEFNATNNSTFITTEDDGARVRRHVSGTVYITTVGLYNSDRELVGVARLADPVRVRARDHINIRLKMDF
jgi:hypothetical protein